MAEQEPTFVDNGLAEKPKMIEIPEGLLTDEQMEDIAARTAAGIVNENEHREGRSGLGVIPVEMPADPSRVPGWNGVTKR